MRHMVVSLLCVLVLTSGLAQASCLVSATISALTGCGLLNPFCILQTIISDANCPPGSLPLLSITLTGGNLTQSLTQLDVFGIQLNTYGDSFLTLLVDTDVTVQNDISLGGNSLLQVASGFLLNVLGNLQVATGSNLRIAGNVSVTGFANVYGTLQLAGSVVRSTAQTAWLTAPTVSLSGWTGLFGPVPAYLRGNGGIVGDVICGDNVIISAGNSPGAIFVDGNLFMVSTDNMIIEVESASSFDTYIISHTFTRGNAKATLNFNGYAPSSRDRIIFVQHGNSTGYFSTVAGNVSPLVMAFGLYSTSIIYDDATVPSYCTSTCTAIPLVEQEER